VSSRELLPVAKSVAWSRSKGYAADHILSLDLVTADGLLRHVTAASEPKLFWALRGGMATSES
jgi:FAD/FMN-containing dehydrogenase